jgi:hypothetical protein
MAVPADGWYSKILAEAAGYLEPIQEYVKPSDVLR